MKSKKTQLMRKADRLWFESLIKPLCEICGLPAQQVHHWYYKGSYGHLRYDLDNGIPICQSCHFKIHFKDPKPIIELVEKKRGKDWAERLKEKSRQRQESFKTVKYYEEIINNLKNNLKQLKQICPKIKTTIYQESNSSN